MNTWSFGSNSVHINTYTYMLIKLRLCWCCRKSVPTLHGVVRLSLWIAKAGQEWLTRLICCILLKHACSTRILFVRPIFLTTYQCIQQRTNATNQSTNQQHDFRKLKLLPEDDLANFDFCSKYAHQLDTIEVLKMDEANELEYLDRVHNAGCCTVQ
jgi:hypothetical protein